MIKKNEQQTMYSIYIYRFKIEIVSSNDKKIKATNTQVATF